MIPSPMNPTVSAIAGGGYRQLRGGGDDLVRLGEMLVRRAVAVLRQRRALAGRTATRRRPALDPTAFDVVAGHRHRREVVLGERHVALYDEVDALLRRHREVDPDVVEQGLGRFREVVPVGSEAVDRRLTGTQHTLMVARAPLARLVLEDVA